MRSAKPAFLRAVLQLAKVISSPNWPSVAGASMATTFFPALIKRMTSTIKVLEPMAPNGQLWMHAPHWMHFFSSITQIPYSSYVMASTGHTFLQGRSKWAMALYGHACAHLPHSRHFSGSIWALLSPMEIAPKGQEFWHAFPIHLRQLSVTV